MVQHGQFVRNRKTEPKVSGGRAAWSSRAKRSKFFLSPHPEHRDRGL